MINAAIKSGYNKPLPIVLEAGDILLTETNMLGAWDSIDTAANRGVMGLNIRGAGPQASRLVIQQDSNFNDLYFYDNQDRAGTASNNRALLYPQFSDFSLARQGRGTAKVHGFRIFSTANGYPSQKWRVRNVHFSHLGKLFHIKGNVNGSENAFFGLHAASCDTFLDVENAQAVNQTVIGCDFERAKADVFKFTGGSGLIVIGGSYIMDADATADHYILNAPATRDGITGSFLLEGLRTEMRSAFARVCNLIGNNNAADYVIRSMSLRTTTGGTRNSFVLDPNSKIGLLVEGCEISADHLVRWIAASTAGYEFKQNRWARATFRNNRGMSRDMVSWGSDAIGWTEIFGDRSGAMDFSGGGKGKVSGIGSCAANADRLKIANGWLRNWPCTGRDASVHSERDYQVVIPIGSVITAVHVKKRQFGVTRATYRLEAVDGNGVVFGQSTLGQQQAEHVITATGLRHHVTDELAGTVRVRTVSGSEGSNVNQTMNSADEFAVEYY
ncbi:hypothetical protein [Mesorhizobium sp. M0203]|uniref:hypothetical protein n=1 Tax=Mesorhizobium sp. M0203 TaxID=2956912 RepID=UPI00333D69A3